MAKLDIIVTHHKEPSEIVNRFLNSLANQTFHDLKVTIVDDGLDCPELRFYTYTGRLFPFEVEHLKKEHKTVSAARNFGLDNTVADYLMFCDCDDVFYDGNKSGMEHAMRRIEDNGLFVYRSCYISEVWKKSAGKQLSGLYSDDEGNDELTYTHGNKNGSNVHCKIYNRKFVNDNNIRFLDDLYMNEDSVFNGLAFEICMMLKFPCFTDCEEFYVWKYNKSSVTRTNKLYPLKGYDQFLKAISAKNEKKMEICSKYGVEFKTDLETEIEFMFQTYYWLVLYGERFSGKEEYESVMNEVYKALREYISKFGKYVDFGLCTKERFKEYKDSMIKRLDKCDVSKKITFEDWYNTLKNQRI